MARVYLCRDLDLDVDVAVKVLPAEVVADARALEEIRAEAKVAARLRGSPAILPLFSFEQYEGTCFLVMEYAPRGSVHDLLRRKGTLSERECRRIGVWVAEALSFAHRNRILHRDIKPANILLDQAGRAKVADFGLARAFSNASSHVSMRGAAGTPAYLAPEAIRREKVTGRADLYSLGCMLFEMSTGRLPFEGTLTEVLAAKAFSATRPPDPRVHSPSLSEDFAEIVIRLMEPDPALRFPDPGTLGAALRRGLSSPESRPGSSGEVAAPPESVALERSSRRPYVLVAALLVLVAAGYSYWHGSGRSDPDESAPTRSSTETSPYSTPSSNLAKPDSGPPAPEERNRGATGVAPEELPGSEPPKELGPAPKTPVWCYLRLVRGPPFAGVTIACAGTTRNLTMGPDGSLGPVALEPGEYEVVVSLEGHVSRSLAASMTPGESMELDAALEESDGLLYLDTDPQGAEVFEGERSLGKSPLAGSALRPGKHTLRILHSERDVLEVPVDVRRGIRLEAGTMLLPALAVLDPSTLPAGVTAALGGHPLVAPARMRSGDVTVRLSRPRYGDQDVRVNLRSGETVVLSPGPWTPNPGRLDLAAIPAEVAVAVNGEDVPRGAASFPVAAGTHRVEMTRAGCTTVRLDDVLVDAEGVTPVRQPNWVFRSLKPVVPGLRTPPRQKWEGLVLPAGIRSQDGRTWCERDGAEMVLIPAGEFEMGGIEKPVGPVSIPRHRVFVSAFLMDRHEVTNAQFAQFVRETRYKTDKERKLGPAMVLVRKFWWEFRDANWTRPQGPGSHIQDRETHPAVLITWNDANAYARWAGKRLPSAAEQEKAIRGGMEGRMYPWGDEYPPRQKVGNLADLTAESRLRGTDGKVMTPTIEGYEDGFERTSPVGSFPANGYGIFDLVGNAEEWCSDWFSADAYMNLESRRDPRGPAEGTEKLRCTSCWQDSGGNLLAAFRSKDGPESARDSTGFRTVRSVPPVATLPK